MRVRKLIIKVIKLLDSSLILYFACLNIRNDLLDLFIHI